MNQNGPFLVHVGLVRNRVILTKQVILTVLDFVGPVPSRQQCCGRSLVEDPTREADLFRPKRTQMDNLDLASAKIWFITRSS